MFKFLDSIVSISPLTDLKGSQSKKGFFSAYTPSANIIFFAFIDLYSIEGLQLLRQECSKVSKIRLPFLWKYACDFDISVTQNVYDQAQVIRDFVLEQTFFMGHNIPILEKLYNNATLTD